MLGPKGKMFALAMYISFVFVSISFPLGPVFQWNMGFKDRQGVSRLDSAWYSRTSLHDYDQCNSIQVQDMTSLLINSGMITNIKITINTLHCNALP